jgi:3-methyladenine DNA glycosylase AlkD
MITINDLRRDLKKAENLQKAKHLMGFFKTGKGEYGEGDIFLGIVVPKSREIAEKYSDLDLKQLGELIKSKYHEERLIALFILVNKYQTTNHKKICFHFYIKHMKWINNWDLVDLSAPKIVGEHLLNYSSGVLSKVIPPASARSKESHMRAVGSPSSFATPLQFLINLAQSKNIWERRIAVLATFAFIKNNIFNESLKIAEMLLKDEHDLIHKAVGWMLREIGKRDQAVEIKFLNKYYKKMPRTMLRYAIERFPTKLRLHYLSK